ncbi:SPOR domain-containing protein [Dichotomicrobium thermohalophilum]|uniref:Sporulation related protein n=1 Tax=Dichotomicrobium thermohalophilum TaxID=933063 RepID=A0A397Q3G1_9HYPH|nr:SPOR domain-containing protein [Dichotomicrobium thermohalophilum]RIA55662.1 sporulation related protein [Dichotomicrobium thermohalophilum]
MPRSDDSNGFPPGRLRRPYPRHGGSEWGGEEPSGNDWRYPDPAERYSQGYDSFDTPPSRDPYGDEWQSGPAHDERFDTSGGFPGAGQEPSWSEQHDPFDWDAPDPPEESGWRPAPYPGETQDYGGDTFAGRDPWAAEDEDFEAPRRSTPHQPAARDDSLFRRIDGSVQEPDLSALTNRAAPDVDPFAAGAGRDPSELRDRFFTRTGEFDEPAAEPHADAPRANIFDFEAHRGDTRHAQLDDPYSWDAYDDEPAMPAPDAAAPAHDDPYAEDYDPYDPYAEDPHLHAEEDLDADFLDDEPEVYEEEPVQQPKSRRKLMVAGVLVAAVATGGAAAFLYKSYQDGSIGSGDAPTLLAEDGPVKSKPSDPGGKEFPDGNKQIYDRLTGDSPEPAQDAQASGGEESTGTTSIPGIVTTGAEAPADTLDERIAAALRKSGKAANDTQAAAPADPNSPRPVRTLTVRPDGSVVPAQGAQGASANTAENLPDDSETVTTAGIVATTGSGSSAEPAPEQREEASASEPQTESASQAPDPAPRPERAEPRPEETQVASAEPATTSSTQPSTTAANPYFIQLAARRDQTSALAAFADLQQKYPNILDGLAPTIKRADLGDKGIWYRLWVGPMDSRGNAQDVCDKLKQAGLGGCFVRTE